MPFWLSAAFTSVRPQLAVATKNVKESRRRCLGTYFGTRESIQILLEFNLSVRKKGLTSQSSKGLGG
jgi:hypothetical protein